MTERNVAPEIASASLRRQTDALDDDRLLTFEEAAEYLNGALSGLPSSQAR
jgi:hypothetical protein